MHATCALAVLAGGLCLAAPAGAADSFYTLRDGLPHANGNLRPDRWMNVISLGGSAIAGQGASQPAKAFRPQMMQALRAAFPGAGMGEPLVSGGSGSWWAAFCAARGQAVYGEHLPGAIMFCDLAADDTGDEAAVTEAAEGVVRAVWSRAAVTDLVFVYTLAPGWLADYRAGRVPTVVQWHERVAAHYGIASVNLGLYVARHTTADDETGADARRPNDRGHALYAAAMKEFITAAKAAAPAQAAPPHKLGAPLTGKPLERGSCVPYERCKLDEHWKLGQASPVEPFRHVATCDGAGATVEVTLKGDQLGLFEAAEGPAPGWEVAVDGGNWTAAPADGDTGGALRPHVRRLVSGLDPAATHTVRLRTGGPARIGAFLAGGEVPDPFAGLNPLQRLDALYATMDKLDYTPPAGRWSLLPKTMDKLRAGGPLKMVLLGDSIMNQTCHSGFDKLVTRMYPKAELKLTASVRGSTGCWWYKDDNRIEEYVLKHQPDLLMIGGISQRDDVDSIRACIQQVRAKQQPEILLMTPAFGFEKSAFIVNWTYDINPAGSDYRARLLKLAADEHCEFVDMTGPWWKYVKDSGKCYGWFRGDAVHANERGTMILARILEKWFAPK